MWIERVARCSEAISAVKALLPLWSSPTRLYRVGRVPHPWAMICSRRSPRQAGQSAVGPVRRGGGACRGVAGQYVEQRAGDGQQQDQRQPGRCRGGDALLARDDGDGHERPG